MTADKPHLTHDHIRELLTAMIRVRHFEDKCAELYTQEKIRGFLHLYDGEEAVASGVIPRLGPEDRVVATYCLTCCLASQLRTIVSVSIEAWHESSR